MVIIVSGLPGSGKSYFASHLAEVVQAIHLKSDQVRMELEKMGDYDQRSKLQVYQALMDRMAEALFKGYHVIVDATFHKEVTRQLAKDKIEALQQDYYYFYLTASEEIIHRRVTKDRSDSEANFRVYEKLKADMDPITMPHLILDSSDDNVERLLIKAKAYIGITANEQ